MITDKKENSDRTPPLNLIKQVWEHPIVKIAVCTVVALTTVVLVGGGLKAGAFAMNSYKDFRDAARR